MIHTRIWKKMIWFSHSLSLKCFTIVQIFRSLSLSLAREIGFWVFYRLTSRIQAANHSVRSLFFFLTALKKMFTHSLFTIQQKKNMYGKLKKKKNKQYQQLFLKMICWGNRIPEKWVIKHAQITPIYMTPVLFLSLLFFLLDSVSVSFCSSLIDIILSQCHCLSNICGI